ncbi:hypothetical protein X546_11990 [Brevibacillus borstelensis cifa_chp40]|nr:hypothetical protein X546_11990 [Brevibacillus borstelensis cifa_chp40]
MHAAKALSLSRLADSRRLGSTAEYCLLPGSEAADPRLLRLEAAASFPLCSETEVLLLCPVAAEFLLLLPAASVLLPLLPAEAVQGFPSPAAESPACQSPVQAWRAEVAGSPPRHSSFPCIP